MGVLGEGSFDAERVASHMSSEIDPDESTFEAMDFTLGQAANAVDGLRDLLRRLEALSLLAREHHRNEVKIGQLFIRAQDYVTQAMTEAEEHARAIIAEAEFEAARIVSAAKDEAHRLITDARKPGGIPPEAIKQLQVTVDGFARLNSDLLRELSALSQTLASHAYSQVPSHAAHEPLPSPPPPAVAWGAGGRSEPFRPSETHRADVTPLFHQAG
jgi:cell division septum initiation protein DivIVA